MKSPPNLVDHSINLKSILVSKQEPPRLVDNPTPKKISWNDNPVEIPKATKERHKQRSKKPRKNGGKEQGSESKSQNPIPSQSLNPEPSPTEDLMREHGLLNRILLIYEHYIIKITTHKAVDYAPLQEACLIVRKFIEDYHEPMEEKHIFAPLLERNIETSLINELIKQHRTSKIITDKTLKYIQDQNESKVHQYLYMFVWMYRAHESREDTLIFNQFRQISTEQSLKELAEVFEKSETERFGSSGYENLLAQVQKIESKIGIDSLEIYTPSIDIQI